MRLVFEDLVRVISDGGPVARAMEASLWLANVSLIAVLAVSTTVLARRAAVAGAAFHPAASDRIFLIFLPFALGCWVWLPNYLVPLAYQHFEQRIVDGTSILTFHEAAPPLIQPVRFCTPRRPACHG